MDFLEENIMWVAAAVGVAVLVLLVLGFAISRRSKTRRQDGLREEFREEYTRSAREHTDDEVVRELEQRKERVDGYNLRELTAEETRNFTARWRMVKAEFVSSPSDAVVRADELLASIMIAKGYDVNVSNEDRAVDLSVGHPAEAMAYREITEIAARNARGDASTEDLRYAMVGYERVVESMLGNRIAA